MGLRAGIHIEQYLVMVLIQQQTKNRIMLITRLIPYIMVSLMSLNTFALVELEKSRSLKLLSVEGLEMGLAVDNDNKVQVHILNAQDVLFESNRSEKKYKKQLKLVEPQIIQISGLDQYSSLIHIKLPSVISLSKLRNKPQDLELFTMSGGALFENVVVKTNLRQEGKKIIFTENVWSFDPSVQNTRAAPADKNNNLIERVMTTLPKKVIVELYTRPSSTPSVLLDGGIWVDQIHVYDKSPDAQESAYNLTITLSEPFLIKATN